MANYGKEPIFFNKSSQMGDIEPLAIREYPGTSSGQSKNSISSEGFVLGHLNEEERDRIFGLIARYADVFARDSGELKGTKLLEHEIHLTDQKPIKCRPYRVPRNLQPELQSQIAELLEAGVIWESDSAYSFPVVLLKKRSGDFRFCVDFRKLNSVTRADAYPLPLIDQTLDRMHRISSLDLTSRFHQIPIRECDKYKIAFICVQGACMNLIACRSD